MGQKKGAGPLNTALAQRRKELGLTLEDVAKAVGVSAGTVSRWESGEIDNMRRDRIAALARALRVSPLFVMGLEEEPSLPDNLSPIRQREIPLLGQIAGGKPMYAEESAEGMERLQSRVQADFCLEVRGESMANAGIHTGDIVFIRRQPTVEEGEIAAVLIDGEATLKRFYRHGDGVELRPENSQFKSMFYAAKDCSQIQILGKAVALQTTL